MKWLPTLLALTCLVALSASAQAPNAATASAAAQASTAPTAPTAPTPTLRTEVFTLANGMTLIVRPDRRAPTVVHMVWVRVGSMDEVDGTSGVAHVLEHMLFKGTATLAPGEFSRRVAALGGRENAFTARDYTGYYQQVPSERLEDVMKLEADRFANNRWADDEFRREIEVVKEERRLRTDDNPRSRLYESMSAVMYQAAPYRRPIVGWMSDLDAMTPDDVRDFYRRWYTPSNAAVVVAGDVDVAAVRAMAERHYGGIPARPVPERKPREEPAQNGLRRLVLKAPADQAYVVLAFKVPQLSERFAQAPSDSDRDALALTMLASVLDGHRGARLDRALTQGPDRVADSAGAGNGLWGRGPQSFVLDAVVAAGKTPEQVEAALREQVARVAREGVSESELRRVKTQWLAAEVYKLDSVFNQAREIGTQWILGHRPEVREQLLAQLRAVTAEQVQRVAQRYFGDDELTVAHLLPVPRAAGAAPARRTAAPGLRH